jgi:RNA recognition motif-containing protein
MNKVFIGNLPYEITIKEIYKLFKNFGKVREIKFFECYGFVVNFYYLKKGISKRI